MENVTLVAANSMKRPTPSLARFDKPGPKTSSTTNVSLQTKLLSAGLAACFADLMTFPLDTAKVRLQIQGEGPVPNTGSVGGAVNSAAAATTNKPAKYRGVVGTICTISRHEGPKALYSGLCPGLQRQMCFASIRIGLYDNVKRFYMDLFQANSAGNPHVGLRILAGVTTGGMAVACAQPTDVVKVRFQAQAAGVRRYKGVLQAYRTIAVQEGIRGLWKGTSANIARNGVVNATELVSYDLIKEKILLLGLLSDNMPCHFVSGVGAGFCTTLLASPIDVVKTRFMNSGAGTYSGVANCAVTMFKAEGATAFYKGFWPSFMRLGAWNIVMFVCFEQLKRQFSGATGAVQPPQIPQLPINISQGPSRYI